MAAPPIVSPSSLYSCPPPPYSYPASTASSVVGGHNGYISPSDSRKGSDDDKEPQQSSRHSLPSISEALLNRGEAPLSITSLLSKTGPPQPQQSQPIPSRSPTSPSRRTYTDPPPRAPATSLSHSHSSPIYSEAPSRSPYSPRLTTDSGNPRSAGVNPYDGRYSAMQPPKTAPSPANISRPAMPAPQFRHSSPTYENVPRSAPTMNPSLTYGAYPTPYSYGPPMQPIPSYPPSSSPSYHPAWRYAEPDNDRSEDPRRAPSKDSPVKPGFGEAIKRHLEVFDLETSLNEASRLSGI